MCGDFNIIMMGIIVDQVGFFIMVARPTSYYHMRDLAQVNVEPHDREVGDHNLKALFVEHYK